MKNLYTTGCLVILLFTVQNLAAQDNPPLNQHPADKPQLFASLPDKFEFPTEELQNIFNSSVSAKANLKLNSALRTDAIISERVQKGKNMSSVNLKLSRFSNALFNLSMINDNGMIRYTGRIVSRDHGDILILQKENDKYFFIKQQQKFTMVE